MFTAIYSNRNVPERKCSTKMQLATVKQEKETAPEPRVNPPILTGLKFYMRKIIVLVGWSYKESGQCFTLLERPLVT